MKNAIIGILATLVVVLGCTLGYVLLNKDHCANSNKTNNDKTIEENKNKVVEDNKKEEVENIEETKQTENVAETRICTGVYSGSVEGPHSPGTLTVELKPNGSYLIDGYEMGEYIIFKDLLLLKDAPDVCGPGQTCYPSYTVNFINEDCSTISWLYGSARFTFTKQN